MSLGAIRLDSGTGLAATFVPAAGMIGVSLSRNAKEMLGQRRGLDSYLDSGRTMGMPILYPWANRLDGDMYSFAGKTVTLTDAMTGVRRDANGLPIHGTLGAFPGWVVDSSGTDDGLEAAALKASLDFGAHPELLESFPFPHLLDLEITLRDETLSVKTTVTATGELPVPLAFGFHPYLTLPGVEREDWTVSLPEMTSLGLDKRGIPDGESSPSSATEFRLEDSLDDAYAGVAPGATFRVSGGDQRATVRFESGYPAAQVFAPAGETVICFEPMKAPANSLVTGEGLNSVAPGESDVSIFSITVA